MSETLGELFSRKGCFRKGTCKSVHTEVTSLSSQASSRFWILHGASQVFSILECVGENKHWEGFTGCQVFKLSPEGSECFNW